MYGASRVSRADILSKSLKVLELLQEDGAAMVPFVVGVLLVKTPSLTTKLRVSSVLLYLLVQGQGEIVVLVVKIQSLTTNLHVSSLFQYLPVHGQGDVFCSILLSCVFRRCLPGKSQGLIPEASQPRPRFQLDDITFTDT